MNTLVAFPSAAGFGQQVALAFHECDALAGYMTSFAYRAGSPLARAVAMLPGKLRNKVDAELGRRAVTALPEQLIESHPFWEIVRTIASKAGAGDTIVDRIWDHQSRQFTRAAAQRIDHGVDALYAFEYTAREAFEAAERRGVAKILDFPSLDSRQFEALQRREKARYPELVGAADTYFDARFEARQARRDAEAASADVIITNSSVTRASHIAAGVDPNKILAVPCGAPPAIDSRRLPAGPRNGRLHAVWAGTFGVRKGAHYFIEACRSVGADVQADVFGAVTVPERVWKSAPRSITFHGSVARSTLFDAFDSADVLVFPTLSDGFGMVVTEAFARGLPVITTDQAGASDLVIHEHNGLIVPAGDAVALAGAMRWCMNNRERLAMMRYAALETARKWQWSDYRRALIGAVATGLTRAGFAPAFVPPSSEPVLATCLA
jgi:glycosyltransferase involved in cell wall biosynthesis